MICRGLGNTDVVVSRLCFGTIPLGIDSALSQAEAVSLLRSAFDRGVTFVDTAELYGTQETVGRAIHRYPRHIAVATKSYAHTYEGMDESLRRALDELGRDMIDIFLLHEQESEHTLRGHAPALARLIDARAQGVVRAIGLSTHRVAGVRAAMGEAAIDVVHAIINARGVGITDGTMNDMLAALTAARASGRGVYAMKAYGGGHLISQAESALGFVAGLDAVDSIAVGMASTAEIEMNCRIIEKRAVPGWLQSMCERRPRRVLIEDHCSGCESCVKACAQGALSVDDGRATVVSARCVVCGYCVARCPEMAIKLF